jgi:hypothetical protein
MKNQFAVICIIATGLAAVAPQGVAAEVQTNAPPTQMSKEQWQKLTPEERQARMKALRTLRENGSNQPAITLREQLRALPPAEREAKLKEWRAQQGFPPLDPELQKRREELMQLPPEERRAKLEQLRKSRPAASPVDENAREKRRADLEKKLAELRTRKAEGKLSPEDEKRLEHLERAEKIMQANPPPAKPAEKPAEKTN